MFNELVPIVVPLAFFWAVAFIARTIGETRTRRRLIETQASPEFAAAVMRETSRDIAAQDSLKWGLLIGAVGLALIVVQFLPYRADEPIALGVILVFAAAGFLAHYAATRRLASAQR